MRVWLILLAVAAMATGPVRALDLSMPGKARLVTEKVSDPDSYRLPIAPFADGALPVDEIEGRVTRQAWRTEQPDLTTLHVARALTEQLGEAGFDILLDCAGQECGGFDFRFNTDVMPAPDMYVDLFDFRYLAARNPKGEVVSALVSLSAGVCHVQIIHAAPTGGTTTLRTQPATEEQPPARDDDASVIAQLTQAGHVILTDLDFRTGSTSLGSGPHASLQALAEFLKGNTARRVALVGHTDMVGTLADNTRLSKARAGAVRSRLIDDYGVPAAQLDADGVGYLSPIAPNTSNQGREVNRRVEAILLSME